MAFLSQLDTRANRLFAAAGVGFMVGGLWYAIAHRGPSAQQIEAGRVLFAKTWTVDDPDCGDGDGLGPVFNADSCVACHFQGGPGGGGPASTTVTTFEVIDADQPGQLISGVVHKHASEPEQQESSAAVSELFAGDTETQVRSIQTMCGGVATVSVTVGNPVRFHTVDSPPLWGLGVIESISDWSLVSSNLARTGHDIAADFRGDFKRNGRGVMRMHAGGKRGRFGWKGQFASVDEFVAAACAMELGLSNPRVSQPVPGEHRGDPNASPDMTEEQLESLIAYVKSLPRPQQIYPTDPSAIDRVHRGEAAFTTAACNDCHLRSLGHVDGIYTDFKLYKLQERSIRRVGGGYGGGPTEEELFDWPAHLPDADHWQTPALWGVADSSPYMHDGSVDTIEAAIERHGGDASFSRDRFRTMPAIDRQCLIEFLETLRAPIQKS